MKVRAILKESFGTYFHCWGTLVARAFAVYLALSLAVIAVERAAGPIWGVLAAPVVVVVGYTWLQALHLLESASAVRGEEGKHHVGPLMIWRLLCASLLFSFLFLLGLVLFVVPGLLVGTWLGMLTPAIVLERRGVFAAMRRSRQLVKGHVRKVFTTYTVAFLIVLPAMLLLYGVTYLMFHTNPELMQFVNDVAVEPVTAPLMILVITSMYFRLTGLAAPLQAEAAVLPAAA